MRGARAAGLLGGWLLDAATGDPRRGHPVAVFGSAAERLERRLYQDGQLAGAVYAAVLVGVPALGTWTLDRRLRGGRWALLGTVTWAALGSRTLGREAHGIGQTVGAGRLADARRRLPALVGRDPDGLGQAEICRAVVESVAENTVDAVVAPLLWGALAGPGGVVAHRCANTLDAMVGHRSPRYARFGTASARLDDVLAWVPARVTLALAVVMAPLIGGSSRAAARVARRDRTNSPSPNAGLAEAAFAGALGRRLGGVNHYGGGAQVVTAGPFGDGPDPDPADIERAVRLSRAIGAAAAILCAAISTWSAGPR